MDHPVGIAINSSSASLLPTYTPATAMPSINAIYLAGELSPHPLFVSKPFSLLMLSLPSATPVPNLTSPPLSLHL